MGTFAVPFRVSSQKNMAEDNVLCNNWYLLGEEKIQATPTNRIFVPLGVLFKISHEHPHRFIWESPPGFHHHKIRP